MTKGSMAIGIGALVFLTMVTASSALAAPVCIDADVQYELDLGTAGDAVVVTGKRFGATVTTISGTGFEAGGEIVIGFNSHFDFGSGSWNHPAETAMLRVGPDSATYDITYHGESPHPTSLTGSFTIIPCPAVQTGGDPNAS